MDNEVKELLNIYVTQTFSPELQKEYRNCFLLFESFEYARPFEELHDIVLDVDADNSDYTQIKFGLCIDEHISELYRSYRMECDQTAPLTDRIETLAVLIRLPYLEDPSPVLAILETMNSPEEKIARVCDLFSDIDEGRALSLLTKVDESLISKIQENLYEKEQYLKSVEDLRVSSLMMKEIKDFFEVFGEENLAYDLLSSTVTIGNEFDLYLPYVKEYLVVDDDQQTAINILSIFFMSIDTWNDPLMAYRKYSEDLLIPTGRIVKIEVALSDALNKLRSYQKANDEAQRLSLVQHQA